MATQQLAEDPVCGMQVDPERAAGQSEHIGRTYYFCSAGCKERFDRDPARFVEEDEETDEHKHGHHT